MGPALDQFFHQGRAIDAQRTMCPEQIGAVKRQGFKRHIVQSTRPGGVALQSLSGCEQVEPQTEAHLKYSEIRAARPALAKFCPADEDLMGFG